MRARTIFSLKPAEGCAARPRWGHGVCSGGEGAEREGRGEGGKLPSPSPPEAGCFLSFYLFIFSVLLAQRVCEVNYVEPPREESASSLRSLAV